MPVLCTGVSAGDLAIHLSADGFEEAEAAMQENRAGENHCALPRYVIVWGDRVRVWGDRYSLEPFRSTRLLTILVDLSERLAQVIRQVKVQQQLEMKESRLWHLTEPQEELQMKEPQVCVMC